MLSNAHFYHRVIRKMVIVFGNMFNNLKLVRYNQTNTAEIERITVPLSYASKEKFYKRITEDPQYTQEVQIVLPRMAFSMDGLSYDPLRKISSHISNFGVSSEKLNSVKPVPYNFDFNLHLFVRNTEDGTQIIEQILPYFTPDYTVTVDFFGMDKLEMDIPIVFNSINVDDQYEGDKEITRMIVWTLNFTVKGYLFGPVTEIKQIKKVSANIYDATTTTSDLVELSLNNGSGNYKVGELVYQGNSVEESSAKAFVYRWTGANANTLILTSTSGNFKSNSNIIGAVTGTKYNVASYLINANQLVNITIEPSPNTANAWDDYGFTETIEEYPDIT